MKKLLFSAALCLLTALFLSGCVLLEPFEKTSTITTSQIYTEDGSAAGYEEKEWSLEGKLVRETQYDAEDRVVVLNPCACLNHSGLPAFMMMSEGLRRKAVSRIPHINSVRYVSATNLWFSAE